MGGSEIVTGVFTQLASIPGRIADVALVPTGVLQHFTDDRGEFDDNIAAATKLADIEREMNWAIRDALTPRATALEYSEHAIVEDDPFDAMSHAQIFAHVDEMKPDILVAISSAWTEISGRVVTGISAFNDAVESAIGDGWQGKGGSAALEAVLAYSADGQELQTRVQLVANKVEEARIALGQAKQSIPRPSDASGVEQIISMIPGESWRQAQHEAEEAERLARQVMKEMYLPYLKRADDQVPVLPPAFNPITSGGGTSGGGGLERRAGDTGATDSAGGAGTVSIVDGAGSGPSAGGSGATAGAGVGDSSRVSGSGNGQGETGFGPATTSAASAVPQSVAGGSIPGVGNGTGLGGGSGLTGGPGTGGFGGGGSAGGAGGLAGGGLGANGLGGSGLGGSGLGASGLGGSGLGGSVAGGGLGGAGGSGARGGAAGSLGAAGSRGMMAGGMGGMAGGRGQGDDDKMHETPGYLITLDNGNELIGDLPMVTPPVLGQ